MKIETPVISRELERVKALAMYNLDYATLQDKFSDLTLLATQISGTSISLINLLDSDTLWSVAGQGMGLGAVDKKESVCKYTIETGTDFEIINLGEDIRFCERSYVKSGELSYYYGISLNTLDGHAIGALCVLDNHNPELNLKQKGMLQLLGREVISRLDELKRIAALENTIQLLQVERRMLAHDIRGPLGGISGLAEMAAEEGESASKKELLNYLELIKDSSHSVLELATEILQNEQRKKASSPADGQINLLQLKKKLEQLFAPRIRDKEIELNVFVSDLTALQPINKYGLQQILGNLISNAIKFTSKKGFITVELALFGNDPNQKLKLEVKDSGQGMSEAVVNAILKNGTATTEGTNGETGYGLGLQLVKQLVAEKNGTFDVVSKEGKGSAFTVVLPAV
jgi:signal transduction histidine kinase